jgi:uncharacterized protein (TIGR00255 family)
MTVLETKLKGVVGGMFSRGRFDISVSRNGSAELGVKPTLNLSVARSYCDMLRTLETELHLKDGIRAVDLLQLRDVMVFEELEVPQEMGEITEQVLRKALGSLKAMRCAEGQSLEEDLRKRLSRLELLLNRIEKRTPLVLNQYGKRLRRSVEEFTRDKGMDRERLMQEMALMADRRDISEESVRLRSHLTQFRKIMDEGKEAGRRLDFLVQEIHREVNTIASKAGDAKISQNAVEMKGELEKIREQVQNIE